MGIAISSIGLATAQGSAADIASGQPLCAPGAWPWPLNAWTTSEYCRPAVGLSPTLSGVARWQALIRLALAECLGERPGVGTTPIFLASCNGCADDLDAKGWRCAFDATVLLAGTPWAGQCPPVFSSSCSSGLHALYAAKQILLAGQANEAVVLAADILSRSNQDNFEALRVLTNSPLRPWQTSSDGFILGEAAVALKLVRTSGNDQPQLIGPVLGNELAKDDGLPRVLEPLSATRPQLLLGQGTGPFAIDEAELAAFRMHLAPDVPLATSLVHFGHTLGASGLLSVALAALSEQSPRQLSTLTMPASHASDGRPLNSGTSGGSDGGSTTSVLVSCRALNGSCAAARVNRGVDALDDPHVQTDLQIERVWQPPLPPGPLMHGVLRQLAAEALGHRPPSPPDLLLVFLDEPLAPPAEASIGGRLLPSAVLEMTPGFVSQLIARCWGFAGPALCLVGGNESGRVRTVTNIPAGDRVWNLVGAANKLGLVVHEIQLRGTGDKREIIWNN